MLNAGAVFAQQPAREPPSAIDRPPAERPYDIPPRFLRSWATPYSRPKYGPKKPPDANAVLEILIDKTGRVAEARVVRSLPFFDDVAIAYVKSWLFSPALKDGQPVAVRQLVSIRFGRIVEREMVEHWDAYVTPSPAPERATLPAGGGSSPTPATATATPSMAVAQTPAVAVLSPAPTTPSPVPDTRKATLLSAATATAPRIELVSLDTQGVDFSDWLTRFSTEVARNWHAPKAAGPGPAASARFEVEVGHDGTVSNARLVDRSGSPDFDHAGLQALFASQFPPLPARFASRSATLVVAISGGANPAP